MTLARGVLLSFVTAVTVTAEHTRPSERHAMVVDADGEIDKKHLILGTVRKFDKKGNILGWFLVTLGIQVYFLERSMTRLGKRHDTSRSYTQSLDLNQFFALALTNQGWDRTRRCWKKTLLRFFRQRRTWPTKPWIWASGPRVWPWTIILSQPGLFLFWTNSKNPKQKGVKFTTKKEFDANLFRLKRLFWWFLDAQHRVNMFVFDFSFSGMHLHHRGQVWYGSRRNHLQVESRAECCQ